MTEALEKRSNGISIDGSSEWLEGLRTEVESARALIAASDVPAEVNEIRMRAAMITGAAARAKAEALALAACDVQVHAERRLGELRARIPLNRRKTDFDEALGFRSDTAWKFERISRIPQREFDAMLRRLAREGRRASAEMIVREVVYGKPKRVESGIYVLGDGRYMIKWKKHGRRLTRTLHGKKGTDIDYARRELAIERGLVVKRLRTAGAQGRSGRVSADNVNDAAADLQRLIQHVDWFRNAAPPAARIEFDQAISFGQQMEQAIIRAFNQL